MKERDLVKERAGRATADECRREFERIERGIKCAASPGALKRYLTRRTIFQDRLRCAGDNGAAGLPCQCNVGMSVNIKCASCGSKFNVVPGLTGSFGKERIP